MCFSGLLMPGHALVCPIRTANQQQLLKWAWCWWVKFCWIGLNPGTLAPSCELCLFVCNQIISNHFLSKSTLLTWLDFYEGLLLTLWGFFSLLSLPSFVFEWKKWFGCSTVHPVCLNHGECGLCAGSESWSPLNCLNLIIKNDMLWV